MNQDTYKKTDNFLLGEKVQTLLSRDKRTQSAKVHVSAGNGIVTIVGYSKSLQGIHDVSIVAQQVAGVVKVVNKVGLRSQWLC